MASDCVHSICLILKHLIQACIKLTEKMLYINANLCVYHLQGGEGEAGGGEAAEPDGGRASPGTEAQSEADNEQRSEGKIQIPPEVLSQRRLLSGTSTTHHSRPISLVSWAYLSSFLIAHVNESIVLIILA